MLQGHHRRAPTLVGVWVCPSDALRNRLHFRRRLFLSEARLEPPEDSQESRTASRGSDLFARKRKWHPNLRVKIPQAETAGHHADDGVRIAIDPHHAAEHSRISVEFLPPQLIAQNHNVVMTELLLAGQDRSTDRGSDA